MDSLAVTDQQIAGDWFADEVASAASSAGAGQVAMVERSAPEGSMPPLLRRDEAETYSVLSGEVVFFVGSDMVWAGPGDVVVAPAGAPRSFRVASDGARWLVLTRVRSLDRFTDFGRAVSAPLADPAAGWPSRAEEATVASMAAANGIELLGPPGALPASCCGSTLLEPPARRC
jgi:mannose-6-phosphate isomerase-like protein (cupin superfamily)